MIINSFMIRDPILPDPKKVLDTLKILALDIFGILAARLLDYAIGGTFLTLVDLDLNRLKEVVLIIIIAWLIHFVWINLIIIKLS